jgi:arabinan endo-1,5-alpha-L-arabinosidase
VLDIRPLLWKDGWPVAGENLKDGTYEIESMRTGTALELAVEGIPVGGRRARRSAADVAATGVSGALSATGEQQPTFFRGQGGVIPAQDVAQVSTNWPHGSVAVRLANYLCQAQQKWSVTAVTNAGGYPGSPYFKISVAGTDRTLAATEDGELVALPAFTGGPEQLWRIDQLTDGTWRIMSKVGSKIAESLTLSAIGSSSATLARFNPDTDKQRWLFKTP